MKADLKFKAVWWNSFLFYWALIFLLFALVAALRIFLISEAVLWRRWAAFAGAKTVRLLEVCFLMKETDTATRVYLAAVNLALGCGACWLLADLVLKHSGIVKPGCFFVRTENVYGRRTCTSGERVRVENGYGRRTGIMKAGEG